MKVIVCRVGEEPKVEQMEPGLDSMQKIVGGLIECVQLSDDDDGCGVDLWCNEEGLFCCTPNRLVFGHHIHGNFFLARHDEEGGTVGLSDRDVAYWLPMIAASPIAIVGWMEDRDE